LRAVLSKYDRGQATDEELRQAQDESIRQVIAKQEALNLPVVTDGEFRRRNFQESFAASVSGFDVPTDLSRYYQQQEADAPAAVGRIESGPDTPGPAVVTRRPARERLRLIRNAPLEEYRYTRSVTTRPVKVTLVGPDRVSQRFNQERSRAVYRDLDEFVADVVAIQHRMVSELLEAGCPYIQIDAPGYTAYVDPPSLARMRARGEDPDENLERSIKADNAVIEGFSGATFGIHVCRGNPRGVDPQSGKIVPRWHREGPYDAIAERLFNGLGHHRFLLEYDSERAGGFEPLRFVPKGKIVVLGLITTKSPRLESVDELKRRIHEASRYLPLDQLALSPQCGFGGLSPVVLSPDDQWRKLDRMMEAAAQVWG
jgi:5-methyltetrahydropteroyltriglutamate--homocysteine methyltransferase